MATNLRALRGAAGLSQAVLAVNSHISPATVARIEAGALAPRLDTLTALAATLGCTVAELVAS